MLGRSSPPVCPLAALGRASPEPPAYRHQRRRYDDDSDSDSDATSHYRRALERRPRRRAAAPPALRSPETYHLSRSSSSSIDHGAPHALDAHAYYVPRCDPAPIRLDAVEADNARRGRTRLAERSAPAGRRSPSLGSTYFERYETRTECQCERTRDRPSDGASERLAEALEACLRSSPSLDQGYHTLVSPSPGPSTPRARCERPRTDPFDRLPDELVLRVFAWLECSEVRAAARVCRRFAKLAWHPALWRRVRLGGAELAGERWARALAATGAVRALRRLELREAALVTERALALFARRAPLLTHLTLQGSPSFGAHGLAELLTRTPNLQHLDLTGCSQVNWPQEETQGRLALQYLDLTDCIAVTDAGLRAAVRVCPHLLYLYLRRCVHVSDAGLKFIPAYCSNLKELSVSDCVAVTDFGLYELAKLGAALRYLSVAKCTQVSDAGVKAVARRCYRLRYVNARGCEAVSDDALVQLARSCPRLRALDLGKCDVGDAGLGALAHSCPNLKKLSLRACDLVTDRGVQCVAYYCRGLQQLNIQDCQVTLEGYRAVKKYCKRCIIEHTNPGFC